MTKFHSLWLSWLAVLVLLGAGLLPANPAYAQTEPPPASPPTVNDPGAGPPGAVRDGDGNWRMRVGAEPVQSADATETGGPDDYGYVWDDSVALNWIDATNGTDTGMGGESWDQRTGAIPLPFAFKYYDAVYSSVYIGAAGYVAFQDSPNWTWTDQIHTPLPSVPNAVISPFSTPLDLATSGKSGRVFYKSGGVTPNRYFVVAWNDIRGWDSDERYTFEVVLYENGDVLFQYRTMTWGDDDWYYCGYVGIENTEGLDGFGYGWPACVPWSIRSGAVRAIRFTRPAPAARVNLTPRSQGRFSRAGSTETFNVTVHNNGELGADLYNVTFASIWPSTVGMSGQPLTDTNSDGILDTGSIAQGERKTLTVQVQTPAFANVADTNLVTLNVRSTRDPGWQRNTLFRTAIATPFAQIYEDWASPGIRTAQPNPDGMVTRKLATAANRGGSMAIAGTPSGGYAALWSEWQNGSWYMRGALLDRYGAPQAPIQSLVTTLPGWIEYLGVAAAPNGYVGLSWQQVQSRQVNGRWEYNYNVYFAILNSSGAIVLAPANLTNNGLWGDSATVGVPRFFDVQIAASGDNRFLVAWYQDLETEDYWLEDIYYAVFSSVGGVVKPTTQFSVDGNTDVSWARYPRLSSLTGNRFLLAYFSGWTEGIRTAIVDSAGNLASGPRSLTSNWEYPRAVAQMSNGSILTVWDSWRDGKNGLRYALLRDSNFDVLAGPTDLVNPFSFTGDWAPSIAVDAANRAVITWGEDEWSYRPAHFYALLDGNGAVLTPPLPWLIARTPANGTAPVVSSSSNGYGVAPNFAFSPTSTSQPDVQIDAPPMNTGAPAGGAQIAINLGNRGLPTASGVIVTAELDPNLTFLNAEPAPTVSVQTSVAGGDTVTWNVPDLRYLSQGLILLSTGVPSATIGSRYPVTITISTASSDADQDNNTVMTEVMVAEQVYLPSTQRSDD